MLLHNDLSPSLSFQNTVCFALLTIINFITKKTIFCPYLKYIVTFWLSSLLLNKL